MTPNNFMSSIAQILGFKSSEKKVKNGAVKPAAKPNGVVEPSPEDEEHQDFECTQEMLSEKFQKAMDAADAHRQASHNLTDATLAGGLKVSDVLAAKKKAGLG